MAQTGLYWDKKPGHRLPRSFSTALSSVDSNSLRVARSPAHVFSAAPTTGV